MTQIKLMYIGRGSRKKTVEPILSPGSLLSMLLASSNSASDAQGGDRENWEFALRPILITAWRNAYLSPYNSRTRWEI